MNPIKTVKLFAFKIRRANYGSVIARARTAAHEVHRPTAAILADVLWCSARYGAAFTDYFMFEFYKRPSVERAQFITMSSNNKLIAYMNDTQSRHVLDRKTELVVKYRPFMHREITVIEGTPRADVIAFFRRNPVFFAKKNFTFSAKGVERFDITGQCDLEHVYDEIVLAGFDLVEQPIIQHHEMARLYAKSVNTLRVVTVFMDDKMDIVYAALKTGNGSAVDNMNAGGLSAAIDVASGVVYTDAIIKGGGACSAHPISGVVYKGFKIPMWDEVQKLLEQVVRVTPGLRFVGWDVAITEDGPILVEGNYIPGYDLLQLPDMTGKKWIIDKYVK